MRLETLARSPQALMLSVLGMDRVTQPARTCQPRFDVNDFLMHNMWVTESAQPGPFIFHCSHNSSQLRAVGHAELALSRG